MNSSKDLNKEMSRRKCKTSPPNQHVLKSNLKSYVQKSTTFNNYLDISGEEAGEASTLARLASSLWMAEASEVGLAAEPE